MRNAARWVLWTAASVCLPGAPSAAADDDWYSQEEGSSSHEDEEDDSSSGGAPGEDGDHAAGSASQGWGLGLRLAYALPFGDAAEGGALSDLIEGAIKPQLDISYGLDEHLVLGAYLALGGGLKPKELRDVCDMDRVDCRLLVLESGLLAEYRVLPRSFVDPWAGVNVGLEWLSQKVTAAGNELSLAVLGVGFGASAGADFELGGWAVGPFLGMQIGRFMRSKVGLSGSLFDDEEVSGDGKIERRAYHYWLNVGLRLRYP